MPKLIISGVIHELMDEAITIGRGPDNTIVVTDPSISTHHAQLLLEGDTYRLKDLDSTIVFGLARRKRGTNPRKPPDQSRCRSLRRSRRNSRQIAQRSLISPTHPRSGARNSRTTLCALEL